MGHVPLPSRSRRFGVGKEIGGAVYVHRKYEHELGAAVAIARARIPSQFEYTVVKFTPRTGTVTFVVSEDFDTADEPTVGDLIIVPASGPVRCLRQRPDPFIYHHKHLMVRDDYPGFSVEANKARSARWLAMPGIDVHRIGRKSYWERVVLAQLNGP